MKKGRILIFALILFALDAWVKYWVQGNVSPIQSFFYPYGGMGVFQDFFGIDFSINRVSNLGGAWGVFASYPTALLCLRIGIILTLAIYTLFFNKARQKTLPFMLILVGASGNIMDFFVYGSVVDMFHFVFWGYSYPVFNVADMLIFFGVATLLIQTLIEKLKKPNSHATQPS